MAKKKNKQLIRPWCWYCEREFEDEKVLMQHQKAKHFKCGMCPRRLNTAGGLAVHIQQVHKLEPENLPRIENALPGRDGYEVEIFGMEGIPAPDVADYKRRKEIELGLAAGSISQPQAKRPKIENRVISEDELRRQLEEHKALMGLNNPEPPSLPESTSGAVYAAPQTYAAPPVPLAPGIPSGPPPASTQYPPVPVPPSTVPSVPPAFPPPFAPGVPLGAPVPGFPLPPPLGLPAGVLPPFHPPGVSGRPPFPPPGFVPPPTMLPEAGPGILPPVIPVPSTAPPPPRFVPARLQGSASPLASSNQTQQAPSNLSEVQVRRPVLALPDPPRAQTNPDFKKPTDLKFKDANFSPDEHRAIHTKYFYAALDGAAVPIQEEPRGKKRARAEDFL